jgi:hypothetical protein
VLIRLPHFFELQKFAIHRNRYRDKSVSENDTIFAFPISLKLKLEYKNGIIFAYRQVSRPAAASGKISLFG